MLSALIRCPATFRRRAVASAVAALLLGSAPWWVAPTAAHADDGTTVTSPDRAWQWDPAHPSATGSFADSPRTVTVDQTSDLVTQVVHVSWQHFSPSDSVYDITGSTGTPYPVRIYECDSDAPTSSANCFGSLKFSTTHPGQGSVAAQSNLVTAVTASDGTGGVDFPLLTGADNSALGCGPSHACSLVVEPYAGGDFYGRKNAKSGPGTGDQSHPDCQDHSLDNVVNTHTYLGNFSQEGNGAAWDQSCNWAARIVVPLHFAPTPNDCPNRDSEFSSEGSPTLQRAMNQWRAGLCQASAGHSALSLSYTGLSEYQARNDFDRGTTDLGLTSQPDTSGGRGVAYAPVAVSTIAVAYYVDDQKTGQPITDLRLDPRLLAKMLTQSYTGGLETSCPSTGDYPCASEVAGNPASVFADPEFLALNKDHYTAADFPTPTPGSSFPTVVFGQSDSTYQLTRWIESDPDAAAFLQGQPDPWHMKINSAYLPTRSPAYPLTQFSANDPGATKTKTGCGQIYDPQTEKSVDFNCLNAGLQNTWFPVNGLDTAAQTLAAGKDTGRVFGSACNGTTTVPIKLLCTNYAAEPAQPQGNRALFAVVSGGDVGAYRFPTAQLETRTGSDRFVNVSTSSVSAAVSQLKTNADKVTGSLPFNAASDAYPLTMVDYAMVPVCGLSTTKAAAISAFLTYAASDAGNQYGVAPGNLASGYLALDDSQRSQTRAAASRALTATRACAAGEGPINHASGGGTTTTNGAPAHGDGSGGGAAAPAGDGTNPDPGTDGGSTSGPGSTAESAGGGSTSNTNPSTAAAAFGTFRPDSAGLAAVVLPVVLIAGAILLLAGPSILFLTRTTTGIGLVRRTRRFVGSLR